MAKDGSARNGELDVAELSVGRPPRRFFIVDGFLEPAAAEAVFAHLRRLAYTLDDADRPDTLEFNHFKHDFQTDPAVTDPIMKLLANRARAVLQSQGIACGPIHRIYANMNLFGDFQFAHQDGDGWTALLLANSEWHEDWGGEFIAYGEASQPFDYAISPRPGRMLIFDGLIRHRGGVPSKLCHAPRISVAIKFQG